MHFLRPDYTRDGMTTRNEIPADCPRDDGDMSPMLCHRVWCPHHAAEPTTRGPVRVRRRTAGDDCVLNIANRGTHRIAYVALVTGLSRQSVKAAEVKGLDKIKKLGIAAFFYNET